MINLSMGLSSDTNPLDFSAILADTSFSCIERFEIKLQKARLNRNYFVSKREKAAENTIRL